jgi:hypothetical protein
MRVHQRLPLLTLTIVFACSSLISTTYKAGAQADGTVVADSGFRPEKNGFSFPNYSAKSKESYTDMTAAEAHRMFGDVACERGTESKPDCTLLPTVKDWMENTNAKMDGGHCGGMAILSYLIFTHPEALSEFSVTATPQIDFNTTIQREIAYWWGTNALPGKKNLYATPNEVIDQLVQEFQKPTETYSLEMWKGGGSKQGHAVTPFAVQDMGNGITYILAYDNNKPGKTAAIEVDRNANTWKYNLSINPSQQESLWSGDADSKTMFLAPNSWRLGVQPLPFDPEDTNAMNGNIHLVSTNSAVAPDNNQITLTSKDGNYADILFTDDKGHKFGYQGGKFYNDIPGASVDYLPSQDTYDTAIEPIYYIPRGIKFSISLDGSNLKAGTINNILLLGPGYDLSLDGIKMNPGDNDTIVFSPDGTEITYTPSAAESPNIGLAVVHQGADYEFDIQGSDVDKGGTINVKLDYNQGTLMLHTTGSQNPATYNLAVDRYSDNEKPQSYEHSDLSLDPAATVTFEFGKWDGKGALSVGVDSKSDGSIDETQNEANQHD